MPHLFFGGEESFLKEGVGGSDEPADADAGDAVDFKHGGDGDDLARGATNNLRRVQK